MKYPTNTGPMVLIADDEEDLLILMSSGLKKDGFRVSLSHNGGGIFAKVISLNPDIILLDITMNGVNGGDICKELKKNKNTQNIPVVMFSANEDLISFTANCGADDCLAKPSDAKSVSQKLEEVVHRNRH